MTDVKYHINLGRYKRHQPVTHE